MEVKGYFQVNKKLLPFKLHFFFIFGGFSSVIPFVPLIAKHIGINATALGIGYSMAPIFIFFFNPLFGFLVDYFQNIKIFLVILLISSSVSFTSILYIPPIESQVGNKAFVRIYHLGNHSQPALNLSTPFKRSCIEEITQAGIECKLQFNEHNPCHSSELDISKVTGHMNIFFNATLTNISNTSLDADHWVTFDTESNFTFDPTCKFNKDLQCIPTITSCLFLNEKSSVFYMYQFWIFITLAITGNVAAISMSTLSSVACYEALGTQIEAYGRQRLFGTISVGLMCYLAGTLNDISNNKEISFSSGFYLMAIFFIADFITICVTHLPKVHYSSNMCSDLGKILKSVEILLFASGVTMIGAFNSVIVIYEFWYLQDLGASQMLLGLTIAVQCLIGEMPFLFFSGWIVKKLGLFLCFVCVFAGFALRLMLYSMLQNPWLVLPIEILHGVTFGIYHSASTSFAKVKAPKGMEATVLGLFSGLYDGLGYGIGSALGGVCLDNLGERRMFFSASMMSVGCFVIFLVASYFFRRVPEKRKKRVEALMLEDTLS